MMLPELSNVILKSANQRAQFQPNGDKTTRQDNSKVLDAS